jgi:predicted RNA-binding protein with EMAP domain
LGEETKKESKSSSKKTENPQNEPNFANVKRTIDWEKEIVKPFPKKENLSGKYANLTREELIKKIEELEVEIKELKQVKVASSEVAEFQSYLDKKQKTIQELKDVLTGNSEKSLKPNPNNANNELPSG